jgi:hypothetical protein
MFQDKSRYISNCLALKIKAIQSLKMYRTTYPMQRLGPSATPLQNLTSHITEKVAHKPLEKYNELKP